MENIIDSRATLTLPRNLIYELALYHLRIVVDEQVNHVDHHRAFVVAQINVILFQCQQFSFVFQQLYVNLLIQAWNASLNMPNQYFVQRFTQIRDPKLFGIISIARMLLEKYLFVLNSLRDGQFVINLLLGSAFNSKISELQWVYVSLQNFDGVGALVH